MNGASIISMPKILDLRSYNIYCRNCKELNLDSLSILSSATINCEQLETIRLPNLTSLSSGRFAWDKTPYLRTVHLGSSTNSRYLYYLYSKTFNELKYLESVYLHYPYVVTLNSNYGAVFYSCASYTSLGHVVINVPESLYQSYINTRYWTDISVYIKSF